MLPPMPGGVPDFVSFPSPATPEGSPNAPEKIEVGAR